MSKTGVLLINLGSPDAPTPEAVGTYLREFLMDEHVIDMPAPLRWVLVNVAIVPRRKHQSAEPYRTVWTENGSPLITYTQALADALRPHLPDNYLLEIGMRYGRPKIADALARLRAAGAERILAVPLYPQYAASSYGTAVEALQRAAQSQNCSPRLDLIPPFYDQPGYIAATAEVLRDHLAQHQPEHIIFSYHSLPERHIKRLDATRRHCLVRGDCCDRITEVNRNCYRAHCVHTTRALTEALQLAPEQYTLSFQSRLGRAKWLGPQTEDVLRALAARGVRRVAVSCPSFTADCLETLEEIGVRARKVFLAAGGTELTLVPALNAHPLWVEQLAAWIRKGA